MIEELIRERQKSILEALVREHVRTAKPVASQELAGRFGRRLSPATIRGEMLELDELGYLEQPYTSGGRIPTDRGYRFFVDHIARDSGITEKEEESFDRIFGIRGETDFIKEFGRLMARLSNAYTAIGMDDEALTYETGLSEIADEPEFRDPDFAQVFSKFVDELDRRMEQALWAASADFESVFIGSENPLRRGRASAMIVSSWRHPHRKFRGIVTLVAPKRMDYEHALALLRHVRGMQDGDS